MSFVVYEVWYSSAVIPINLLSSEKFLVARLILGPCLTAKIEFLLAKIYNSKGTTIDVRFLDL